MKKLIIISCSFLILLMSGCLKTDEKQIVDDLKKKIDKAESYKITGVLKLVNDEENYLYDVEVAYKNKNNFRVSLTNQTNNHEQIILRDNNDVYVLTPSLNKSFKFESNWPYNNSQVYILQTLVEDINGDKNYSFEEKDNKYLFKTTVNYPNNSNLIKQKITTDKKLNFKKVEVYDRNNEVQMEMKFNKIDLNANFDDDYFKLDANMKTAKTDDKVAKVSNIEDSIYPMYLPQNTYLEKEDKVAKENGERIIMTFSGDSPFMLVQETVTVPENYTTVFAEGEPALLANSVGIISDNELTWNSDGIDYYIVSKNMDKEQLVSVAKSLGVASLVNQK